jgi:hypothetical protein
MNLRKSLFTGLAAVGLMASLAAPVALAQSVNDSGTTTATVAVTNDGVFNVQFCSGTSPLSAVSMTSESAAQTSTGSLTICYEDTLLYHDSALVSFQATAFTAGLSSIAASNFKVTQTNNTIQEHYVSDGHGHTKVADPGYLAQDGTAPPQNATVFVVWPGPANTLDVSRNVNFIYNGSGAGSSTGLVNVALNIPVGTVPGNYSSTVTLTVAPGGPTH